MELPVSIIAGPAGAAQGKRQGGVLENRLGFTSSFEHWYITDNVLTSI